MVFFEYFIPIKLSTSFFPGSLPPLQPQAGQTRTAADQQKSLYFTSTVAPPTLSPTTSWPSDEAKDTDGEEMDVSLAQVVQPEVLQPPQPQPEVRVQPKVQVQPVQPVQPDQAGRDRRDGRRREVRRQLLLSSVQVPLHSEFKNGVLFSLRCILSELRPVLCLFHH